MVTLLIIEQENDELSILESRSLKVLKIGSAFANPTT